MRIPTEDRQLPRQTGPIGVRPRPYLRHKSVFHEEFDDRLCAPLDDQHDLERPSIPSSVRQRQPSPVDGPPDPHHASLAVSLSTMMSIRSLPSRMLVLASTLLLAFSILFDTPFLTTRFPGFGLAEAKPVAKSQLQGWYEDGSHRLSRRDDTNPDVCSRWSQQTALVNGTIYIYGGHATTQQGQQDGTWTNDFLALDVTKTWE